MKKKAFTLIELLAVIVILAIVALIAVPAVLNIIEEAKKSSFKQTANGYFKAAEYLYFDMQLKGESKDLLFTFEDGKQISSNSDYKLNVDGEVPEGGVVYLNSNGEIMVSIHNGDYCATTNSSGEVTLTENVDGCGVMPSDCFLTSEYTISGEIKTALTANGSFEGMDSSILAISGIDTTNDSCTGIMSVPDEIEGRKVEAISDYAFTSNTVITGLITGDNMKVIGEGAFSSSSNLMNVVIGSETRAIGHYAFAWTSIEEVTIPEKVAFLGGYSFGESKLEKLEYLANITLADPDLYWNYMPPFFVTNLKELKIGDTVTTIPNVMFWLSSTNKMEVKISNSVTSIGDYAFMDNQLTSVTLGNSVTSIGDYAFSNNQLTNVAIPNSVTSIGDLAFSYNQLTSVTIPNSVTSIGAAAFNNNQLPDDQAFIYGRNSDGTEDKTTIVSYGGAKRDNVIIPDSVTSIGGHAFRENNLTNITIPDGVTTIEYSAFYNNKLTGVTIPDSVTSIGNQAFWENDLTNITIPNSVTGIGTSAFLNNQLETVTLGSGLTSIGSSAFSSNKLTSITIPANVTSIGNYAFRYNSFADASAITIEGDSTRFDSTWTSIGFPAK